jgi:Phage derived protein Gp49-like (DUF891)
LELVVIETDKYTVAAVLKNGNCEVTEFLEELEETYHASVDGLYALIGLVSKTGLQDVSTKLSHCVNEEEKIYEFIKGKLRLFYFKGKGDLLVVCTSGIIKKTQKVDEKQVARAVALKKQYLQAVKDSTLVLKDNDEI